MTAALASFVSFGKAKPVLLRTHNILPSVPTPLLYCNSFSIAKPATNKADRYNHTSLLSDARLADWQVPQSNSYVQSNSTIHQPHLPDGCLV